MTRDLRDGAERDAVERELDHATTAAPSLRLRHVHKYVIPGFYVGEFRVAGSHGICRCGAFKPARPSLRP